MNPMKSFLLLAASFVSFLFFSPLPSLAQDPDLFRQASESLTWQRLLHYRRDVFFHFRSDLDGPEFFFAPNGKTDPLSELKASAEAMGEDIRVGKLKQHPQCAFPERYRYLKKALGLKTKDVECPLLQQYLDRFHHPKSVTLVFSNAYQDNPASMFGHSFLRINAQGDAGSGKLDLLDQGVSFAANVGPNENPLVFYWEGVTGGYPGAFTVIPYYAKVNEYNHAEARDLWEYDLSLTESETMTIVRHLWELETNSWFDYYFFDENCAYQLLSLLEVARPDWNLTAQFFFWAIPGETVKAVARVPGAVTDVKFRPSYRRKLFDRYARLSSAQRTEFTKLRDGEVAPSEVSDSQTLDAFGSYLSYLKQKSEGRLPAAERDRLTQTLIHRSELGGGQSDPELVPGSRDVWNTRPDLGHDASRLGLASGFAGMSSAQTTNSGPRSGLYFQELHWRPVYHDLMNNDVGYLRFSQIEFPQFTFRYYPELSDFRVERIGILSVLSLFPFSALEKKPSWGMSLDYHSPKDYGCLLCHTLRGRGQVGIAGNPISPDVLFYGLALFNAETGESLHRGYRFGPGGEVAALANPVGSYKLHLSYQLVSDLFQEDRSPFFYVLGLDQSLSLGQFWEIRGGYSLERGYDEAKLSIQYYF